MSSRHHWRKRTRWKFLWYQIPRFILKPNHLRQYGISTRIDTWRSRRATDSDTHGPHIQQTKRCRPVGKNSLPNEILIPYHGLQFMCSYSFKAIFYSFPCFSLSTRYAILLTIAQMVAHTVNNLPEMWEARVQSMGQEDPLEKEMAIHSSILAWRIPWTEEPGRLLSMGGHKESNTSEQLTFLLSTDICLAQSHWPVSPSAWHALPPDSLRLCPFTALIFCLNIIFSGWFSLTCLSKIGISNMFSLITLVHFSMSSTLSRWDEGLFFFSTPLCP